MFDLPADLAAAFCPPKPEPFTPVEEPAHSLSGGAPPADLPALKTLIAQGRVLALNMPAGKNPALGRAIGVMLKNAWLQSLLLRPAEMQRHPDQYHRPAVFICDEYQQFASTGEDDPSGDEKSFALTRQSKCIPIVATQSVSSLRAVLGQFRVLAGPFADAPDPHLPESLRRRQQSARFELVRRGRAREIQLGS